MAGALIVLLVSNESSSAAEKIDSRKPVKVFVLAGQSTPESRPTLARLTRPPLAGHVLPAALPLF